LSTASFTNPLVEQTELLAGRASVELDKHLITVTGGDRLSWLHALLSQNLRSLEPGQSAESLLLDPQGHIEAVLNIIDDGQVTRILVDDSASQRVFEHLTRMKLRTRVEITLDTEVRVFGTFGEPLPGASVSWSDPWPNLEPGGHRYSEQPAGDWSYFESVAQESTLISAGTQALTALRVAARRPWFQDVDERSLPHELDWLTTAVHMSKGCYRGQEAVAKVHNLGHPPRRLVLLHLDGSGHLLPDAGAKVFHGETEVGHVTSTATHFEAGPIALALVKRTTPETVELLVAGEIAASQEVIVPSSAGKAVTVPRKNLMGGRR